MEKVESALDPILQPVTEPEQDPLEQGSLESQPSD